MGSDDFADVTPRRDGVYVCSVDCEKGGIQRVDGACPACGEVLVYRGVLSLNLLSNAVKNECAAYVKAKKKAERLYG